VGHVVWTRPLGVVQHMRPRLWLFELPPRGLFYPVVVTAGRGEVAFVGGALGPGDGVIEVVVFGAGLAGGGGAGGGAGPDEVAEPPRWRVAVFPVAVVA
jgi:hypothetical protein